jgi:protein-S-isoprenylcysteine O-methyltransferase Ste14
VSELGFVLIIGVLDAWDFLGGEAVFSEYMSETETTITSSRLPPLMKIVPPLWIVILFVLGLCVNWLFPTRDILDWQCYPAAIILSVVGLFIVLSAMRLFHKRGTEILPHSRTNKLLLIEGLYKFTRNPMYLGMTLMLLSIAFFVGTLPMFVVPVAFFCLIHFVFIPFEEAKMSRQFGEQYSSYKMRVRRWL